MAQIAPVSLMPGVWPWSVVCKLSGNGRTNGILISDYTITVNGVSQSGTAYSNRNPNQEPKLQFSLNASVAGSLNSPQLFYAYLTQFEIQE